MTDKWSGMFQDNKQEDLSKLSCIGNCAASARSYHNYRHVCSSSVVGAAEAVVVETGRRDGQTTAAFDFDTSEEAGAALYGAPGPRVTARMWSSMGDATGGIWSATMDQAPCLELARLEKVHVQKRA